MSPSSRRTLTALLAALSLGACDSQYPPGFGEGETLQVMLFREESGPPVSGEGQLALRWVSGRGLRTSPTRLKTQRGGTDPQANQAWFWGQLTPEVGEFGAGLANSLHGVAAVGEIVIVPEKEDDFFAPESDVSAVADDEVVVYVARDVLPGSPHAEVLGGPLDRGFHIRRVARKTAEEVAQVRACQDAAPTDAERRACGVPGDTLVPVPLDPQFGANTLVWSPRLRPLARQSELRPANLVLLDAPLPTTP